MIHLRETLARMGVDVIPCGPGEEQDCGNNYAHHCLSYATGILARAEFYVRHLTHGDPEALEMGQEQYEIWQSRFEEEDRAAPCH